MWAPETRDGTCRELLLLKLFHRGSSDSPASSVENPCTRLTSVIPSAPVNFIASRGMSGNGPTTVMLKGILEQLAEGHQLPKKLAQDLLAVWPDTGTQHLRQGDCCGSDRHDPRHEFNREGLTGRN